MRPFKKITGLPVTTKPAMFSLIGFSDDSLFTRAENRLIPVKRAILIGKAARNACHVLAVEHSDPIVPLVVDQSSPLHIGLRLAVIWPGLNQPRKWVLKTLYSFNIIFFKTL